MNDTAANVAPPATDAATALALYRLMIFTRAADAVSIPR